MTLGDDPRGEGVGLGRVVGDEPRHQVRLRHQPGQGFQALRAVDVEQVAPVEVEEVEEVGADLDAGVLGSARGGLLEGARPPRLVEGEGLAVEHERLGGKRPGERDDLGQPVGDVVEAAGGDDDLVAGAVDLDPDAVELGVDRDRPTVGRDLGEGGGHVSGARGQHRQHGSTDLEADRGQRRLALEGRHRDGDGRAREHRGAAYGPERDACRGGECLLDEGVEGALPDLAGHEPPQPPLLLGGRAAEEVGHRLGARLLGAGARQPGELVEGVVDLAHLEGGRLRGGRQGLEAPPAQPGAPLEQRPTQPRDDDREVLDVGCRKGGGQGRGLLLARAGGGDRRMGGDQLGDQHAATLVRCAHTRVVPGLGVVQAG